MHRGEDTGERSNRDKVPVAGPQAGRTKEAGLSPSYTWHYGGGLEDPPCEDPTKHGVMPPRALQWISPAAGGIAGSNMKVVQEGTWQHGAGRGTGKARNQTDAPLIKSNMSYFPCT